MGRLLPPRTGASSPGMAWGGVLVPLPGPSWGPPRMPGPAGCLPGFHALAAWPGWTGRGRVLGSVGRAAGTVEGALLGLPLAAALAEKRKGDPEAEPSPARASWPMGEGPAWLVVADPFCWLAWGKGEATALDGAAAAGAGAVEADAGA